MEGLEVLRSVGRVLAGFDGARRFCGGWALDLFAGRRTRPHKDVDVALLRCDQITFYEHLRRQGWSLEAVRDAKLVPWEGSRMLQPVHEIWCRNAAYEPSAFEALLNDSEGSDFLFRRDPTIRLPLHRAFHASVGGLPVLAPEVVLLYKANRPDDETNRHDLAVTLPHLQPLQRLWLRDALQSMDPDHEWLLEVYP